MSYRFSKRFRQKLKARVRHAGDIGERQWKFNLYVEKLRNDVLQVFDGDVTGPSVGLYRHYPTQIDPETAVEFLTMEDLRNFKSESAPS